jgi:Fe-S oxidoreductase
MPRNRSNSFCCGAGGGRIWIPDQPGEERPSENRIREAVALGDAELFVVCCPKDVTMFEDAIKTSGNAERIELRELTELVDEALLPREVVAAT